MNNRNLFLRKVKESNAVDLSARTNPELLFIDTKNNIAFYSSDGKYYSVGIHSVEWWCAFTKDGEHSFLSQFALNFGWEKASCFIAHYFLDGYDKAVDIAKAEKQIYPVIEDAFLWGLEDECKDYRPTEFVDNGTILYVIAENNNLNGGPLVYTDYNEEKDFILYLNENMQRIKYAYKIYIKDFKELQNFKGTYIKYLETEGLLSKENMILKKDCGVVYLDEENMVECWDWNDEDDQFMVEDKQELLEFWRKNKDTKENIHIYRIYLTKQQVNDYHQGDECIQQLVYSLEKNKFEYNLDNPIWVLYSETVSEWLFTSLEKFEKAVKEIKWLKESSVCAYHAVLDDDDFERLCGYDDYDDILNDKVELSKNVVFNQVYEDTQKKKNENDGFVTMKIKGESYVLCAEDNELDSISQIEQSIFKHKTAVIELIKNRWNMGYRFGVSYKPSDNDVIWTDEISKIAIKETVEKLIDIYRNMIPS